MGYMKWVYMMITDGSYEDFKKEYIECVLRQRDKFFWQSEEVSKEYAKDVIKYIDSYLNYKEQEKRLKDDIFSE